MACNERVIDSDICIVGAGVAGLWLAKRLKALGFRVVVLENQTLGGGQSGKSQGIIHGGTKYTLSGTVTRAAQCIGSMPARWRACLAGEGDMDLSNVHVLSTHQYMWSPGDLGSRLASFFASKALRSRVELVAKADRPEAFQMPQCGGKLYRLNELVLDTQSLIAALTQGLEDHLLKVDWQKTTHWLCEGERIKGIAFDHDGLHYRIDAQRFILCSGAGNEALQMPQWAQVPMQRRPLHMVMMRTAFAHPVYVHCLGVHKVPRLTITSHPTGEGDWVWYLGGQLAEQGVQRSADEHIQAAREELHRLMPWLNLESVQWASLRIDRAESQQQGILRPDEAFCHTVANRIVAWPTKLALVPDLVDKVLTELASDGIKATSKTPFCLPQGLPKPVQSLPFWREGWPCH